MTGELHLDLHMSRKLQPGSKRNAPDIHCLVSVIVPCYNAATYLPGAVQSVIAQMDLTSEIIVVNDGSTDDTQAVARALTREYPFIRLLQSPGNKGSAAARNAGLRQAAGEYVCFLDADDEYAPGFFNATLAPLESDRDLAAVTTDIELVDCHREVHPVQLEAVTGSLPTNVMVRKSVAALMGGFPESSAFRGPVAGEDICFRQALAIWFKVCHRAEKLLRYRVKQDSHFDRFLDSTQVVNGELKFVKPYARMAEWQLAAQSYMDEVGRKSRTANVSIATGGVTS
jgi:glycosyltransferase involved in cell wall biosynthesis